jgi:hypothetical protein
MVCERCGLLEQLTSEPGEKQTRRRSNLCASCNAKPATTIPTAYGKCRPHKGPFDVDDNPLDSFTGELYRPGKRLCGYSDCVEVKHVEQPKAKPGRRRKPITTEAALENLKRPGGADFMDTLMALHEAQRRSK